MTDPRCAFCEQTAEEAGSSIIMFSPDMDIKPIPICTIDQMILIGVLEPKQSQTKAGRKRWVQVRDGD